MGPASRSPDPGASVPPALPLPMASAYPYGSAMAPVPVQPLDFSPPANRRPGLITAIGILSIVIGSMSVIAGSVQGMQAFVMVLVSRASRAMATTYTQQIAPQAQQIAPQAEVNPNPADEAMTAAERRLTLAAMMQVRSLPAGRRQQLDALLGKGGHSIFPMRGPLLNAIAIRRNITDSGRQFSDDGQGPHFFATGSGRIEVYDDHAVFYPDDGGEPISTSDTPDDETNVEAEAIIPQSRRPRANSLVGGSIAPPAVPGAPPMPVPPPAPAPPVMNIDGRAVALVVAECLASALLGVYLIVIGALTLRQSPSGRRLHRIYAWIKIPLALIGAIAAGWMWSSMAANLPVAGPTPSAPAPQAMIATMWTGIAVVLFIFACAYPVALLIALRSRTAREYYDVSTAQPWR